jgi:hypothetical protein
MNLQLANTEEYIDGQPTGSLGEVLIRCDGGRGVQGWGRRREGLGTGGGVCGSGGAG